MNELQEQFMFSQTTTGLEFQKKKIEVPKECGLEVFGCVIGVQCSAKSRDLSS